MKFRRVIQNKHQEKLGFNNFSFVTMHTSTQPFTLEGSWMRAVWSWWWTKSTPDLALNNFHLFLHMKIWLITQHFDNNEELHAGIYVWLKSQAATFSIFMELISLCIGIINALFYMEIMLKYKWKMCPFIFSP